MPPFSFTSLSAPYGADSAAHGGHRQCITHIYIYRQVELVYSSATADREQMHSEENYYRIWRGWPASTRFPCFRNPWQSHLDSTRGIASVLVTNLLRVRYGVSYEQDLGFDTPFSVTGGMGVWASM